MELSLRTKVLAGAIFFFFFLTVLSLSSFSIGRHHFLMLSVILAIYLCPTLTFPWGPTPPKKTSIVDADPAPPHLETGLSLHWDPFIGAPTPPCPLDCLSQLWHPSKYPLLCWSNSRNQHACRSQDKASQTAEPKIVQHTSMPRTIIAWPPR